jgi:hypothetical protein
MCTSLEFRDPLSHKQGGLIHQFDVWLSGALKFKLLLLYSLSYIIYINAHSISIHYEIYT